METTEQIGPGGAKRLRLTKEERSDHLIAWKRSGRSARDYAAEHGLRAANLYSWSAKEGAGTGKKASGPSFLPVRIAGNSAVVSGLRVTLKARELECVIEGGSSPESFAALAAALKREVLDV